MRRILINISETWDLDFFKEITQRRWVVDKGRSKVKFSFKSLCDKVRNEQVKSVLW